MTKKSVSIKRKDRKAAEPAPQELSEAERFFQSLPPDIAEEIRAIARDSESEEDFCRQVFVGDCPVCGSANTSDCDDAPLEDSTIGRCLDCDTLWCLECSTLFTKGQTECPHWEICDSCELACDSEEDDDDEAEWCGVLTWNCDKVMKWKQKQDIKNK